MSSLKVGPYIFDRAHYDPEADVLYLSQGDLERAADFDETPDGHAISYDKDGDLIGLTLIDVRGLVEGAQGNDEIVLGLPKKGEPPSDTPVALTSADLAPADIKLADLKLALT
jgi:uncharacterized protein YuzE